MVNRLTHGDGIEGWGVGHRDCEGEGGGGSGVTKRVGEGRVERLFRVHELARRSL